VGVHGQTLFHDPAGEWPVTFQAGAAAVLAEELGCTVVSDFRSRDVAAGGQGAPLVPYADAVLLRHPTEERIALNLGGIANLTWLPPGRGTEGVTGFDTGPGNMVMDALAGRSGREGQGYDRDGEGAASGRVLPDLLAEWLRHHFFDQEPPKSTGREIFGEPFLLATLGGPAGDLHLNDLLATAAELTVESVARSCERWLPRAASARRFIVSGGGVHNRHLMQRLNQRLDPASVETSDRQGIPPDAKEAVAFAVLADALLSGVPANLPAVTGAHRPVLLGSLTPATGASPPAGVS